MRQLIIVVLLSFGVAVFLLDRSTISAAASGAPDKAYLQKIWTGWSTLDVQNVRSYYASGPHVFFDIAPLKYTSWAEYEKNVRNILADYKQAKFTVNEDAELHPAGDYVWGTATIKQEMTRQSGKVEMGNLRWSVVFQKQGGKWLIVHEHVSVPMQ
ncbi:MAG: nuclear transport factor 2 family protein [Acidobacteria bacterium]|nr:nuclear transport factor 2 family protein [Acidobacteriota bacterium]